MGRKRIRKDWERFRRIVRREIRRNLEELITHGSVIGHKGGDTVKVPLKAIRLPEFRYDPRSAGGIGLGEGEPGQPIEPDEEALEVRPGNLPGRHFPEVEIELEELAEILGEELELPRIEPKGQREVLGEEEEYDDVSPIGPESLLMKKRSYKRGLLRQLLMQGVPKSKVQSPTSEDYGPWTVDRRTILPPPIEIVPIKEDKRYLYSEPRPRPQAAAVIMFMRDASGSMSGERTEIVRRVNFWLDLWLQAHYKNLRRVYILHDYRAEEVDEQEFYQMSSGGGTRISSAYELCNKIIDQRFPLDRWNIYPFHFSDGENWMGDTERSCLPLLQEKLLPKVNLFCYGQVSLGRDSPAPHLERLRERLDEEKLCTSIIAEREDILAAIRDFLGKGR